MLKERGPRVARGAFFFLDNLGTCCIIREVIDNRKEGKGRIKEMKKGFTLIELIMVIIILG
ncbi:MAG TPA: type II secretion system protein, partial [Candidatus Sulfotelmatobacter sp.]|nr:type II secretion system protein [Candidatus Sulfotelmatobacter sp.]